MIFFGLASGLFGLDLFLKGKIEAEKPEDFPRDLEGTKGRVKLYRNHNDGFCFGLLKEKTELVRMIPFGFFSAAAGIFTWLLTRKSSLIHKLGFSFIVGGAASNLFDRLKRGYVVDYFSLQFGFLKKVVFNIGDLCIFVGTAVLAVSELFHD